MAYVARKVFTYNGAQLQLGDLWRPTGHRNDKTIIAARLVIETPDEDEAPVGPPASDEAPQEPPAQETLPRVPRGRRGGR